jgi:hypothetical protein
MGLKFGSVPSDSGTGPDVLFIRLHVAQRLACTASLPQPETGVNIGADYSRRVITMKEGRAAT